MTRVLAGLLFAATMFVVEACTTESGDANLDEAGHAAGAAGSPAAVPGPSSAGTASFGTGGSEMDLGIEATQMDGVWVFHHEPQGWHDALLQAPASIVDGCLFVGEDIVVWHVDRLDDAKAVIAAVQAGEHPVVAVGGSGISPTSSAESGTPLVIPAAIAEHCSTTAVWFGSPD